MQEIMLKDVWKSFGDITAVKGLSFEAEEGKTLVIVGPSGAGKTTTLRLIAGLEKMDKGEIYLGGKKANALLPYERNLAMTFESYALYPHMTVFENIVSPLKAPARKDVYNKDEIENKVKDVAKLLGIEELLQRMPRELSGGQRQRVALGRTLIKEPRVFLFDEPIAHLDAKLRHRMRGEMKRLFTRLKSAVIYTTHDYMEASAIADKIVVINTGELQQVGTASEIFNNPVNTFVFGITCEPTPNFIQFSLVKKNNRYYINREGISYPVPEALGKSIAGTGEEEIKVGIRPNDIIVTEKKSDASPLLAEIYTYEFLGSKLIVTVKVNQIGLVAEIKEVRDIEIGKKVWIGFNSMRMFLFNLKSGKNVHQRGNHHE
jgi:multiple sugar transport system ATP-binding protein